MIVAQEDDAIPGRVLDTAHRRAGAELAGGAALGAYRLIELVRPRCGRRR
jgi:hypothetical protein